VWEWLLARDETCAAVQNKSQIKLARELQSSDVITITIVTMRQRLRGLTCPCSCATCRVQFCGFWLRFSIATADNASRFSAVCSGWEPEEGTSAYGGKEG
jgi:hypothetical protein